MTSGEGRCQEGLGSGSARTRQCADGNIRPDEAVQADARIGSGLRGGASSACQARALLTKRPESIAAMVHRMHAPLRRRE
jgi:hypothetical protein